MRRHRAGSAVLLATLLALMGCGDDSATTGSTTTTTTAPPALTFYRPPTVLDGVNPGDLLDRSEVAIDPTWPGTGSRVTFVSTTPAGDHVPVTGMVLTPTAPPPPNGYPIVVWGHGTVGLGDPCAPSRYEPFQAAGAPELLQAGYIVVAPDYEGLGIEGETHPYLVGVATGYNLLDAARVGRSLGGGTEAVVFGAVPQGGHATLFARQLAEDYLPEIDLLGVVAAAPVTDPATFLLPGRTEPGLFPFTAEAILAWSEVYEEPELEDLVVVRDAEMVRLARTELCTESLTPDQPIDDYFVAEPQDAAAWQAAVVENTPSAQDVGVPVLLTHGDADVHVPLSGTQEFHDQLCDAGEQVVFVRDPSWGHAAPWTIPLPEIVDWIGRRPAGEPAPSDCG